MMHSGCAHSKAPEPVASYPETLCEQAKSGRFDPSTFDLSTAPRINAYLLECSVAVVISPLSLQSGESKGDLLVKQGKQKAASFLLKQPLDVGYRNAYGDTLLMSVISSFLPVTWKVGTVKALAQAGVDLDARNENGDTALDIAIFKNEPAVIEALKQARQGHSPSL